MLQDLVDKTNLASFTAFPLSLFKHKGATKVWKWSKGTLLLVQINLLCFTSGDVYFLRKEENEKSWDGEHDIVLLMVGTTQNNGKWLLACWQMDKNYSRISTYLPSLSQLYGKIVLHLFLGLVWDRLHIFCDASQIIENCWQMDKNYSRISTHLSSLSQLYGKIVLHLSLGLVWDILHMFWDASQIIGNCFGWIKLARFGVCGAANAAKAKLYYIFLGLVWGRLYIYWDASQIIENCLG